MFFLVVNNIDYCLVYAENREEAKREAKPYLEGDADRFEVTPLTKKEYNFKGFVFRNIRVHDFKRYG